MALRVKHHDPLGIDPDKVRRARREAGLNQVELAHAVGCSPRAVQYWESPNGVRRPNSRYLRQLALATGKPILWFYEEQAA
jgi:transcriptional regulator with XRE-family HTH domain